MRLGNRGAGRLALVLAFGVLLAATVPARAAPLNDDFAGATMIDALPFLDSTDTAGATVERKEPLPSCGNNLATIWYRFTRSTVATLTASTNGSSFDTVLAVYVGTRLGGLEEVACGNTNGGPDQVSFVAAADVTYYVQAGGYLGRTGTLVFSLASGQTGTTGFINYPAPSAFRFAHAAGETSIGVNQLTNSAMFQMILDTARVRWDDSQDPPAVTWADVSYPLTSITTLDPILWTDSSTGRTFVAQLPGPASLAAYTDDDGETWTPMQPPVSAPSIDHETIGGGLYPAGLANPVYPNALYYCAQSGTSLSQCARSDTGGLTWSAPLPMNLLRCAGLHGHVAVGPGGTVYVPHKRCGGQQGVLASADAGLTWSLNIVPQTVDGLSDPKVAFDRGGRMYFVASSGGRPLVATSDDGGATWTSPMDVGEAVGTRNVEFPMVVAGDPGRAAFAFYGSMTPGDDQSAAFTGVWHLYVAFTFDGGASWQTVDATQGDPVQRGCIWLQGPGGNCRNLLDFQDMTVDAQGRVLIGYADGCTSLACIGPTGTPDDSRDSLGTIARQSSGKRLSVAFDPSN